MRHFSRALNAELSKYRKRKKLSLDGSLAGVPYNHFRASRRYVSGMPYLPAQPGYHHDIYMSGTPQAYHPSLNAPAVRETEYEPYEPMMGQPHVSRPSFQPHHMPPQTGHGQEISPGEMSVPNDDMTLIEQMRMAQGESPPPRENIEPPFLNGAVPGLGDPAVDDDSVDTFPSLSEVAEALDHLSRVLPPDHQDLINLRMAAQEWLDLMNAWSQGVSDPYAVNYHETAAPVPAAGPDYNGAMTQDIFEQAMGQVAEEQMVPGTETQPADPCAAMCAEYYQELQLDLEEIVQQATPEQDDWQKQQQMYEEEMMMLMNPYMMPGPFGPMGPMGPMPMPPGLG